MRVLLIDIETSPGTGHVWGLWNVNVGLSQLREASRMLCFSAKWLGDTDTMFWSEFEHGTDEMLSAVHDLLNDADVVVHYNGKRFDVPHINRELWIANYNPPSPYQQIDLLAVVKRQFRFMSNKLAHISVAAGLSGKLGHEGHELWTKCLDGDADAWARMEAYNRQDVVLTEELYTRLLAWIPNHPNRRLYGATGCPTCGKDALRKEGFRYTQQSKFQQFSCGACGHWSTSSKRLEGTDVRGVA